VTGYVTGNLAISVIAGLFTYGWLRIFGVPFAFILALWVAFADLLPLVGATLGAIPPVFVAFLDSPRLGIATIIFFVVYQQFENHVLQPVVMARTVKLNPLAVLVAVIVGVQLAGLLGALLAHPGRRSVASCRARRVGRTPRHCERSPQHRRRRSSLGRRRASYHEVVDLNWHSVVRGFGRL
jgi:hypothetical protein